jgi:cytochrome c peroxidase
LQFASNGLDLDPTDPGVGGISKNASEMGTFKVPALRNVALTAPYMHDGRFQTLEQVVDHYSSGIKEHNNLNPELKNVDGTPRKFNFSPAEKAALVTFLRSLSDEKMVADARFSSPFK